MSSTQRQPQQRVHIERAADAVQDQCVFTTTQEHLARALRLVSGVAGKNPALPILEHVLLRSDRGQLRLSTTDLEIGVTVWIAGIIKGEGALTVPSKALAEYVQNLPLGPVVLEFGHGSLNISTVREKNNIQGSHAVLQGGSAENFPLIPHLEKGQEMVFPVTLFSSALERVLYAVATEDSRPELASVFLHGEDSNLTLAATDSFRLAETRLSVAEPLRVPCTVLVPGRTAHELRRVFNGEGNIELRVGESQLLFHTPTLQLVSRRVEGTYPDYTNIIPQHSATSVEVNRQELLRSIRAAAVFSEQAIGRVTLEVGSDRLLVTALTPEVGETKNTLAGEINGPPATVSFNARFLKEALTSLPSERVVIGLKDATTPAVFRPLLSPDRGESLSLLALVMPIRA